MSDTKLDPGTLRALIDDVEVDREGFGMYWQAVENWLQAKLDALPTTETQVAIQPDDYDGRSVARAIPDYLAEALNIWRGDPSRWDGKSEATLAFAIDRAREEGRL